MKRNLMTVPILNDQRNDLTVRNGRKKDLEVDYDPVLQIKGSLIDLRKIFDLSIFGFIKSLLSSIHIE